MKLTFGKHSHMGTAGELLGRCDGWSCHPLSLGLVLQTSAEPLGSPSGVSDFHNRVIFSHVRLLAFPDRDIAALLIEYFTSLQPCSALCQHCCEQAIPGPCCRNDP